MEWKKSDIILYEYGIVVGLESILGKKDMVFFKKKGNAEREREKEMFFFSQEVGPNNEQ